jgi:hypothetical protein
MALIMPVRFPCDIILGIEGFFRQHHALDFFGKKGQIVRGTGTVEVIQMIAELFVMTAAAKGIIKGNAPSGDHTLFG